MSMAQLTIELSKKEQQRLMEHYITDASDEDVEWIFKSITSLRRNNLDHTEMVRKYAKIVSK